ncbi:MAG: acyltransferase family protein [Verrucomicrobiota bacterium]
MYLKHAKAFACILIVIYHALSFSSKFQLKNTFRADHFFGDMFFYGRVPFFFVVAGYLFHHSYSRNGKMKDTVVKRIKNLIPPYVFWNMIMMLMILISLQLGFSYGDKKYLSTSEIISMSSGIGSIPANHSLWFVRDLMILFLISPLLMRYQTFLPYISVLAFSFSIIHQNSNFLEASSLGFYIIGMYLYKSNQPKDLEARIRGIRSSSIYVYLGAMFCLAFINQSHLMPKIIGIIGHFIGISMITLIGELLARGTGFISNASLAISESSFLIYLSHIPILSFFVKAVELNKPISELMHKHQFFNVITWLCFAAIIITVTTIIHRFIKQRFPQWLIVLTGSR